VIYELWDESSGNRIDGANGEDGLRHLLQIAKEIHRDQRGAPPRLFIEVWDSLAASEPWALLQIGTS